MSFLTASFPKFSSFHQAKGGKFGYDFVFISLLGLGLLVRLPLLGGSFWLDEAAQAMESVRPWSEQLKIAHDFQPPLIHVLTHLAMQFSLQEWWLRLWVALIPSLASLWGIFKIANRLFSRRIALIALLLMSLNSFHVFYSQELRPYALPAGIAVLSWWFLIRIYDAKRAHLLWVGLTTLNILGLYSSYLYPLLIISQFVFGLIFSWGDWQRIRNLTGLHFLSNLITGLFFLPWLPFFWQQLQVGGELRTQLPGWETVVSTPQFKSLALVGGKFVFGIIDLNFSLMLLLIGLSVMLMALAGWQVETRRFSWRAFLQAVTASFKKTDRLQTLGVVLVVCWLVVPILLAWLISFWIPILQPKRVLYGLPPFMILLAYFSQLPNHKLVKRTMLAILLVIQTFGLVSYWTSPRLQRENWRDLHARIVRTYPASRSIAVFAFPEPFAPWQWYDDNTYPAVTTGLYLVNPNTIKTQLKVVVDYDYVLVFDYLRTLTDPENEVLTTIESFGFVEAGFEDQVNIGFVRVYAKPTALISDARSALSP